MANSLPVRWSKQEMESKLPRRCRIREWERYHANSPLEVGLYLPADSKVYFRLRLGQWAKSDWVDLQPTLKCPGAQRHCS